MCAVPPGSALMARGRRAFAAGRVRLSRRLGGMRVFAIVRKEEIAPKFHRFVVQAPEVARKHKPGQFVMVLGGSDAERIPLTIADSDAAAGTITLVVQEVGKTTMAMGLLAAGDAFMSVVGPLGTPTHIEKFGTVVCVGGGA